MRGALIGALVVVCADPVLGAEGTMPWAEALTGSTVIYDTTAEQHFFESGKTLYQFGEPSWGTWAARDGRYCSTWPPAQTWSCYDVELKPEGRVTFTDAQGNQTSGQIQP